MVRVTVPVAALIVALWLVVVPQFTAAGETPESLQRVSLPLALAAVVLELLSLAAYSVLSASILCPERRGSFTVLRIDLSGLGVNHDVPGGGATAASVTRARSVMRLVPVVSAESVHTLLRMMPGQILQLARNPRRMEFDMTFAIANWLLEAAALWLVEGVMVPSLVGFGTPVGTAPLRVIG